MSAGRARTRSDRLDEPAAWIDDDFDRALPRIIDEATDCALKETPWQGAVRR